nr:RNA-directed DNA polymerase, eukaryota, reverse transcriptase zinc-binding domain protein [Tanacetum cinerariifolium]
MSKLDRFLTSESFHEDFPHVTGIVLVNGDPDHRPIILKEFKVDYGPTPFHFYHPWLEMEGFRDMVVDAWNHDGIVEANGFISFKKKLKYLKIVIRKWAKSNKAESNKIKSEHQLRLSSIHVKIDKGNVTENELLLRRDSLKILGDINRLEANDIAQKANIKWYGAWIEEPFNIKAEFLDHFSKRFQCSHGITPSLDGDMPNCLSPTESKFLERQISREEIKKAVWDCGGERCNSSFIALIPKISNAKFVSDFRPISLIGCQYKIIGKILANRLSKVIESIISPEQSAFIKGRNILDGPLILNEVWAWTRKHKQNLMVFKVDFEKAFDSLRWDFLKLVMTKLGFAMEGLHVLTCKAKTMGLFKGASISNGNDSMSISHLMYANDVIFLGIGVSQEKVFDMANTIGCDVATFPLKYLGVPVGCNMARCSYWNDILLKFTSKLSLWKARMVSVGASKELGGLGIGSIYGLNLGLLFKWIWRFLSNSPNLWVRVVKTLHGTNGGITKDVKYSSSHSPWSGILSAISRLKLKGIDLLSLCVRKIGNGASYRFWEDIWCGNQPLKVQYSRIFQLELEKNCFIADRIGSVDWHDVFRRPPRGGAELSQLNDILSLTQDVILSDSSDSWIWSVDVPSGYSVASARTLIDSSTLDVDPKATRWNRFIPNKVNVFIGG